MVGRPRSAECDNAILDATLIEYAQRGFEGLSVDSVATRAGVSKATIYRRFPSKTDLVVAAARSLCETAPRPDFGSLRSDIGAILEHLRQMLSDPVAGAVKRQMLIDARVNTDLAAMHAELVRIRREAVFVTFRRAIDRGELRPDTDLEFAADLLSGPLFYRHLVMHEPITDAYIEQVVDAFMARYGVVQSSPR